MGRSGREHSAQQQGPHLRIVTYNILADKYAMSGAKNYCPKQLRLWSSRWPRLMAELNHYNADIICLQVRSKRCWCMYVHSHWLLLHGDSSGDADQGAAAAVCHDHTSGSCMSIKNA